MPSEEELIALRAEKRLRLLDTADPYPARVERTHDAASAVAALEAVEAAGAVETAEPLAIAGRVTAQRLMGKAAFLDLRDGSGRIQLHIRRDTVGEESFQALGLLDLGDFVQASGPVFRTRTGEATVAVQRWHVIAKALRPMPEKFHGVTDTETRYRQRHLDLMANERSREIARQSAQVIAAVRR